MMGKQPVRRATRTWLGGATGGTLALLALVVVMLPASAGAPTMTVLQTTKVVAPFTGGTGSPSYTTAVSGCGAATIVTTPFFHPRSGDGGFSGSTSARTCGSPFGSSSSSFQAFLATVPIPVTANAHHIAVKWNLHASGGQSLHVGTCTIPGGANNASYNGCYALTETLLDGSLYVIDTTTSKVFSPTNFSVLSVTSYTSWSDFCYAGNCTTSTAGGAATISVNGTMIWHFLVHGLVPSHHYEVSASFSASEYAEMGSYGTATLTHTHGLAWVNCGTFGNGADLNSVTIW